MEMFKNWVLAIIGLVIILAGVAISVYTPYVGGGVLLTAFGCVLVIINITAAWEAANYQTGGDYF